ncbi:MAG: hypothetical protein GY737_18270 [Desulfobacteraceae bacterium]|nr:hypothetical protein [Desulfobacteraceae bacterium]
MKILKRILTISLVMVSLFVVSVMGLSISYETSIKKVVGRASKRVVLEAIELCVHIYDPSEPKVAVSKPFLSNSDKDIIRDFVKIEKTVNSINGLMLVKHGNKDIETSDFSFSYQPFEEPELQMLREKYHLDDVVSIAKDEFEKMVLLRQWCRSQFERDDYQSFMNNFSALKILQRKVKKNKVASAYRPCHLFPLLYAQVLASMGYTARLVTISFHPDYEGHGNVEVWSNQYDKWIAMDADLNLHYKRKNVPLNFLELHNIRYESPDELKIIYGSHGSDGLTTVEQVIEEEKLDPENMVNYCSYFSVRDMRNDWATNHYFKGHPVRSSVLLWVDEKMYREFMPFDKTSFKKDFYWSLNRTEINLRPDDGSDELELYFDTFTPGFDHFEIDCDGKGKIISKQPFYKWKLHVGKNSLSVVSVNKFGVRGVISYVEIERSLNAKLTM